MYAAFESLAVTNFALVRSASGRYLNHYETFFGQVKQENMRWFLMVDTVLLDVKYNLLLAVQTKLASDKRLEYVVDLYQM